MRPIYLVMLPGLDGTGLLFRPLIDALPIFIKPIVVNYPTDKKLGYDDLLNLVIKVLPKEEPFILLGESFSGPLAIRVAATMPVGLKAVVLCASFITCPQKLVPTWASVLVFDFPFYASRIFAKINAWFGGYDGDDMQMALSLVKPEVMAYLVIQVIKVNVTPELAQCNLPILYLQGKNDILVSHANFEQIKKIKPNVQYAQLSAGHLVLQTQPKLAAKLIQDFIEEIMS